MFFEPLCVSWLAVATDLCSSFRVSTNQKSRTPHLTPMPARSFVSSAIPPGRSLTVTMNRHRRPSAANPRSRHLPKTVVSMLPPQSGITTLQKTLVSATYCLAHWKIQTDIQCVCLHNEPLLANIPRHQHTSWRIIIKTSNITAAITKTTVHCFIALQ